METKDLIVIGGGINGAGIAVDAARLARGAAEDIASADDDGDLDAHGPHRLDLAGKPREHIRIDAETGLLALKHFAAEFQHDALERASG